MATIRRERIEDEESVGLVNDAAFDAPGEGRLIESLRERRAVTLSLVAVEHDEVVGHILFSPVEIVSTGGATTAAVGLGPMAVLPSIQRRGIGSQLVRAGLDLLREEEHSIVVVLGHAEYYPRFGFVRADKFGVSCKYDVPSEVFMAFELRDGALSDFRGTAVYQKEFDEV